MKAQTSTQGDERTASAVPAPARVLYLVPRFPHLNTTFIANEKTEVAAMGIEVSIAPLWRPVDGQPVNRLEGPFADRVVECWLTDVRVWLGALLALLRAPRAGWAILRLVPGHLRSPLLPLKLGAASVKGLYLGRWCRRNRMEHIHAHFLTSPTTAALVASAASGIPFTFTAHAFDITSRDWRVVNGSVAYKCRRAAFGVTIAEANLRYMRERWRAARRNRIEIVYNGIDPTDWTPRLRRERPRARAARVLSVGSLVVMKGHEHLVRAVAEVRSRGYDVSLDVFGDGPLRASLEGLIATLGVEGSVRLRGLAPNEEIQECMHSADLFALACVRAPWGHADGLPTVLIEALAVELPTVSTELSGIPEVVIDGGTGRCVPPGSVSELADAIAWTVDNPDQAVELASAGRRLVLERFDRRKNAATLVSLWRDWHAGRA